jgi:hypothetical protein
VKPQRDLAAEAYRPLDEILAVPRMRLLRGLRWFGWVTSEELMLALDVPDFVRGDDNQERANLTAALHTAVRKGEITADRSEWPHRYHLAVPGRTAVAETLARYVVNLEAVSA